MDQNLETRLRAIEVKVDQNNQILIRMRRAQRTASMVRAGYWIIVILLFFVSLYFIKPYLGELGSVYGFGASNNSSSQKNTGAQDLLNQLQQFQQNNQ